MYYVVTVKVRTKANKPSSNDSGKLHFVSLLHFELPVEKARCFCS